MSLTLFGVQCVPMAGPDGYAKTPGNSGVHSKCGFDSDSLDIRYLGPNQSAVSIPVVEFA